MRVAAEVCEQCDVCDDEPVAGQVEERESKPGGVEDG